MTINEDQYQEIVANLLMLENKLRELGGCSDGNCCIVRPQGMHTNGGCHCVNEARWDTAQRIKIERVVRNYQKHVDAIRKAMEISRTIDLRDRGKAR